MTAPAGEDIRNVWIRRAEQLDREGHFASYTPVRRADVLRKGYLGHWRPDRAIAVEQAEKGHAVRTPKFNDEMRDHFGRVGEEVREAVLDILGELPPECYEPPSSLEVPPGYPFVFKSRTLQRELYFKFQVIGTARRPRVLFWSCHPPLY